MTEEEIKSAAKLLAIERFVCSTRNMVIRIYRHLSNMTDEEFSEIELQTLEQLRMLPALGLPPELSDVVADEAFVELKRLTEYAQMMRRSESGQS